MPRTSAGNLPQADIDALLAAGATIGPTVGELLGAETKTAPAQRGVAKKPIPLLKAVFRPPGTWVIPVRVVAGDNQRDFKAKIGRAGHERRAVSKALGGHNLMFLAVFADHWSRGGKLRITLTRLGGRRMDYANVVAAMKYVQDAVCLLLGCDDGDSLLDFRYDQQPGGRNGVRVEIGRVE